MDAMDAGQRLNLDNEQLTTLAEMLEARQASLLVEIRHTAHRSYRDELRHRLEVVEKLLALVRPAVQAAGK
jgi:hypothetical protein